MEIRWQIENANLDNTREEQPPGSDPVSVGMKVPIKVIEEGDLQEPDLGHHCQDESMEDIGQIKNNNLGNTSKEQPNESEPDNKSKEYPIRLVKKVDLNHQQCLQEMLQSVSQT
jgi:hypothetical protein